MIGFTVYGLHFEFQLRRFLNMILYNEDKGRPFYTYILSSRGKINDDIVIHMPMAMLTLLTSIV